MSIEVQTFKAGELEVKAQEYLTTHLGDPPPLPIDIEWLVEGAEGVRIDVQRGLADDFGLLGLVQRDESSGALLVIVDEHLADHNHNRYRMTVAEELGHIILHPDLTESFTYCELRDHAQWGEIERDAKRMAEALLSPEPQVVPVASECYAELVSVAGFENVPAVYKHLISRTAERFEISNQAMQIRFTRHAIHMEARVTWAMAQKQTELN